MLGVESKDVVVVVYVVEGRLVLDHQDKVGCVGVGV